MADEQFEVSPRQEVAPVPPLKKVKYRGFRGHDGEVVYQMRGNKVLFSALTGADQTTSTVNAAEAVIKAICEAEEINWRDGGFPQRFKFYDLMTKKGYPGRKLEDWEINRLDVATSGVGDEREIEVTAWTPVMMPEGSTAVSQADNIMSPNIVRGFIEAKSRVGII